MQFEQKHLQDLGTLLGFMQSAGPTGYDFLKDLADIELPDIQYTPMTISDIFNFTHNGQEIGQLILTDLTFGFYDVNGSWNNDVYDYNTFKTELEQCFTKLENQLNELETSKNIEQ